MHIVHVLTRLSRAGSEENTMSTAMWQAAQGHRVTVICGPDPDPHWRQAAPQVELVEIANLRHAIAIGADLGAFVALWQLYARLRPDVIHTHQSKAGILGRLAARAVPGALVVHGLHILPFTGRSSLARTLFLGLERVAARNTDLCIAVSRSVARIYEALGLCTGAEVVSSGMDLSPFIAARAPEDADRLLGVAPGDPRPPVILMLAALEPRKRHIAFLEAMAACRDDWAGAHILLAGQGPFAGEVRAKVAQLGLENRVTFCGHRDDPGALIALADVCVLTSEREGLPRVVVQSIAGGTPVVVTDLPGIDEIVTDGVNGRITPANDLAGTAQALVQLISDPDLCAQLARGAARTDVSAWDVARLGPATQRAYEIALARRAATPAALVEA